MAQTDGGPAFPCSNEQFTYGNSDAGDAWAGMTLRDWFAGNAPAVIPSFGAAPYEPYPEYPHIDPSLVGTDYKEASEAAHAEYERLMQRHAEARIAQEISREVAWRYAFADAMLAERARQKAGEP